MNYLLFIELTKHDLIVIGGTLLTAIIGFGAIAVAVKNIRVEVLVPVYNFCLKPVLTRRKKQNELLGKLDTVIETVNTIQHEVLPNHGTSLKDSVLRTEKRLEYVNAKMRHNDQIAQDCLFEIDDKGNVIAVNRALCDLLGVSEADLLQRAWISRLDPSIRERVKNEWRDSQENKIPFDSRQTVIDGRDGEVFEVRVSAHPNIAPDGTLLGFFGHVKQL